MQCKAAPEKWKNADYEKYLDGTVRLVRREHDPYEIELDDFAKGIKLIEADEPAKQPDTGLTFHP